MNFGTEYLRSSLSSALNVVRAPGGAAFEIRAIGGVVQAPNVVRIMQKNANPANIVDGAAKTIALIAGENVQLMVDLPYVVPAGQGLFEQCNDAALRSSVVIGLEG